MAIIPMMQN
jgi:hypothetical protein